MSHNNQNKRREEIFHDSEESEPEEDQEEGEIIDQYEEGEVASGSEPSRQEDDDVDEDEDDEEDREQMQDKFGQEQQEQQVYDSSEEDAARMQTEKRKRELLWKQREQQQSKLASFSHEQLLRKAFDDVQKTNKRVMLLRKKNLKRMDDIEKVRMTQQAYLIPSNTHFRGSAGQYPLITEDKNGKKIYHANYSLRVSDMRLSDFIQKNIKEENSANYLNEVVKFQNYAYQQRKKRRQHIE